MIADRQGDTTGYALDALQARGELFVNPGEQVYEGMVIGEHNRESDLDVNCVREKKLSNVRSKNKDENIILQAPIRHTIEAALEFIDRDEIKDYQYTNEGTAKLKTAIGEIDTVIYSSTRPNSTRVSRFWYAPSLGFLPVRAEQERKGKVETVLTVLKIERP